MTGKNLSLALVSSLVLTALSASVQAQDWRYGIGTGPAALAVDGDMGFNTKAFGPIEISIDLDAEETSDIMESAFGFGGYASNGTWTISASFGTVTLEGKANNGVTQVVNDFEITTGELMVGYNVSRTESLSVDLLGGVRYLDHDLSLEITQGETKLKSDIENDWTDVLIGISFGVPLNSNWAWNTRFDAGFGGSEGTYSVNTGLVWRFRESWSATLYAQRQAIEFEEGRKGDSDWYHYDMDETTVGITILYNW